MTEQRPSTFFSGHSNPNDDSVGGHTLENVKIGAVVVGAVFAPIAGLVAVTVYLLLFQALRISWKVLWAVTGLYFVALLALGEFSERGVTRYTQPWIDLIKQVQSVGLDSINVSIGTFLATQAPVGIFVGLFLGSAFSSWRWYRRPSWEKHDLRATPWEWRRRRRIRKAIETDKDGPDDGTTVGIDRGPGRRVVMKDSEAVMQTLVVGGTGAGKTTTILIGLRDAVRRGQGVIYVDLKGATDVPEVLAEYAARYGRRFLHFKIQDSRLPYSGPGDGAAYYDPAGRGDPSRRKDLLLGAKKWDVDYFKQVASNYLQTAFRVADIVPPPDHVGTFEDLVNLMQPEKLQQRAGYIPRAHPQCGELLAEVDRLVNGASPSEKDGVRSMQTYLQTFVGSTAGAWLRKDPAGQRDIDLRRGVDEGSIVVFSLDSSNYGESSAAIANLIIQDLQTLSSELRQRPAENPVRVVVDEFYAVGTDNIVNLVNKCRDSKMMVTLATQALGDLKRVDPAFDQQLIGVVNCFLIHRANHPDDAEIYAGLTGKESRFKKKTSVEHKSGLPGGSIGIGAATGSGMIEEYDEYRVLPKEIQDLGQGQCVYIAKAPKTRIHYPVDVVRENTAEMMLSAPRRHPVPTAETVISGPAAGGARDTGHQPDPYQRPVPDAHGIATTNPGLAAMWDAASQPPIPGAARPQPSAAIGSVVSPPTGPVRPPVTPAPAAVPATTLPTGPRSGLPVRPSTPTQPGPDVPHPVQAHPAASRLPVNPPTSHPARLAPTAPPSPQGTPRRAPLPTPAARQATGPAGRRPGGLPVAPRPPAARTTAPIPRQAPLAARPTAPAPRDDIGTRLGIGDYPGT